MFTDYALMRMRMRDVTRSEVREALGAPRGRYLFNTKHGRMNVRHRLSVSGRTVMVSYEERGTRSVAGRSCWRTPCARKGERGEDVHREG